MSGSISPPLLETVARRACVINVLLEDQADKRELEDSLDVSRTTVNRAVDSLHECGCIVQRSGEWRVTLLGQLAYQEYERLRQRYEALTDSQSLLRYLPTETSFDICVLVDAEVVLAEHPSPHAPIKRLEALLEDCSHIRGLSPVVLPVFVSLFSEQIAELGTDTELVLKDDLVDYLCVTYPDELNGVLEAENATIWHLDQTIPFGLVLIGERIVWIAIYDEDGGLKGAIVNDTDSAISWATDVFRRYREPATQVIRRGGRSQTIHS